MRTDWSKRTDPAAYQNYDETDSTRRDLQPMRSGFWSMIGMS